MAPSQNSRQAPPTSRERRGLRLLLSRQQDTSCLKLLTSPLPLALKKKERMKLPRPSNFKEEKSGPGHSPLPSLQTQEIPRPGADGHRALHDSQLLRPGHGELTEEHSGAGEPAQGLDDDVNAPWAEGPTTGDMMAAGDVESVIQPLAALPEATTHGVPLQTLQPILQPAAHSDAVPDGSTDVSPAVPEGHAHPIHPRLSTQEMKIKAWTRLS